MMSCTVEPGRMSTQKPTRNNCGAQARGLRRGQLERSGCDRRAAQRAARLLRDLDHFPPEHRRRVVLVQEPCARTVAMPGTGEEYLSGTGRLQPVPGRRPARARRRCN
eukprot:scaffold2180_cov75-Phaeocystis_antarctica.AAC.2